MRTPMGGDKEITERGRMGKDEEIMGEEEKNKTIIYHGSNHHS